MGTKRVAELIGSTKKFSYICVVLFFHAIFIFSAEAQTLPKTYCRHIFLEDNSLLLIVRTYTAKGTSYLTTTERAEWNMEIAPDTYLNPTRQMLRIGDTAVELKGKRYSIVEELATSKNYTATREELNSRVTENVEAGIFNINQIMANTFGIQAPVRATKFGFVYLELGQPFDWVNHGTVRFLPELRRMQIFSKTQNQFVEIQVYHIIFNLFQWMVLNETTSVSLESFYNQYMQQPRHNRLTNDLTTFLQNVRVQTSQFNSLYRQATGSDGRSFVIQDGEIRWTVEAAADIEFAPSL